MKNLKKNDNIQNLSIFLICIIMFNCCTFTNSTTNKFMSKNKHFENNPSLVNEVTNNFGFFCLPVYKNLNKEGANAKLILSAVRVNLAGLVECFSTDGKTCMTAESDQCYASLVQNYKMVDGNISITSNNEKEDEDKKTESQILACPADREKLVDNFAWCKNANKLFFDKWMCPATSGLNIAVKLNTFTGNVACLSKDAVSCYTGEQAQLACLKANVNTSKSLTELLFKNIECGSVDFKVLYGNYGYDSILNNWCRKSMSLFYNKQEIFYPVVTDADTVITISEKGNPQCISGDAKKCVKYSSKPTEAEKKYVANLIDKKIFVTITCGKELKQSDEDTTGYEKEDHWCNSVLNNMAMGLVQLQPVTSVTKRNIVFLAEEIEKDLKLVKKIEGKISNKEKEIDVNEKKMKEIMADDVDERDVYEVNDKTEAYLNSVKDLADLNLILENEKARLVSLELKLLESQKELGDEEIDLLGEMKKRELQLKPKVQKRIDRLDKRSKVLDPIVKKIGIEIAKVSKVLNKILEQLVKVKKELDDINKKITKQKNDFDAILKKIKEEEARIGQLVKRIPILIKLPFQYKKNTKKSTVEGLEILVYPEDKVKYDPILKDGKVYDNISNFLVRTMRAGYDVRKDSQIDLSPINNNVKIVIFHPDDPKKIKEIKNVINIEEKDASKNPYNQPFIDVPYSQLTIEDDIKKMKNLQFFADVGTEIMPTDLITLANLDLNTYMKSYEVYYIDPSTGSKMQEVSGGPQIIKDPKTKKTKFDSFALWEISKCDETSTPIRDGSCITLKHTQTGKNLYSQPRLRSPASRRQEIACFTGFKSYLEQETNSNHKFKIEVTESLFKDKVLRVGDTFKLTHITTDLSVGIANYNTPRTSQKEAFCFNAKEEETNPRLSSRFVVTTSFAQASDKSPTNRKQTKFETKERLTTNPKSNKDDDKPIQRNVSPKAVDPVFPEIIATNLVDGRKKVPFSCPESAEEKAKKPFCINKITQATNYNLAGMSMIKNLRNLIFEKIGAPINTKDKIKIITIRAGLYMSFDSERHTNGSLSERVIATKEKKDDLSNVFTYKYIKKNKAKNEIVKLVHTNKRSGGIFTVRTHDSFEDELNHTYQLLMDPKQTDDGYDQWEIINIQTVVNDKKTRVGNEVVLKNLQAKCFICATQQTDENNNNKRIMACCQKPNMNSILTISYNNNADAKKDYLKFTPNPVEDNSKVLGFVDNDKEIDDIEGKLKKLKKGKFSAFKKKQKKKLKKTLKKLKDINAKEVFDKKQTESNSGVQKNTNLKELPFPPSALKENKFKQLKNIVDQEYNIPSKDIRQKLVSMRHLKTGAFLNRSNNRVSGIFEDKDIGNFWKVNKDVTSKSTNPLILTSYITGEDLQFIKNTNKWYNEKLRSDSLAKLAGSNSILNTNDTIQILDKDFKEIDGKIPSDKQFIIKYLNKSCFLAFVPFKYIRGTKYLLPYCAQEPSVSKIPKDYFLWQFEKTIEDSDGIFPDIKSERNVDLDPTYERLIVTFCSNENEKCKCNGIVSYGANGKFNEKDSNSSIDCTNKVFGDPISGTVKKCYCKTKINVGFSEGRGKVVLNSEVYNTDKVKNTLQPLDYLELTFKDGSNDLVLQGHDAILPGLSQLESFPVLKKESNKDISTFQIQSDGRNIENGTKVRLVHNATGRCLSSNFIKSSYTPGDAEEYLTYLIGENEVCDANSDWIINTVQFLKDEKTKKKNKDKTVFGDYNKNKIYFGDEIVFQHNKSKTYLSFVTNKKHFAKFDGIKKVKTTIYLGRTFKNKKAFEDPSVAVKLNYLGRNKLFEKSFNEYKLVDNYKGDDKTNTVKNSKVFAFLSFFDKTENYKGWNELKQNKKAAERTPGDFVIIEDIKKLLEEKDNIYSTIQRVEAEEDIVNRKKKFNILSKELNTEAYDKAFNYVTTIKNTEVKKKAFGLLEKDKADKKDKVFSTLFKDTADVKKDVFETLKQSTADKKDKVFEKVDEIKATDKKDIFETLESKTPETKKGAFDEIESRKADAKKKVFGIISKVSKKADLREFKAPVTKKIKEQAKNFKIFNPSAAKENYKSFKFSPKSVSESTKLFKKEITNTTVKENKKSFGYKESSNKENKKSFGEGANPTTRKEQAKQFYKEISNKAIKENSKSFGKQIANKAIKENAKSFKLAKSDKAGSGTANFKKSI
jgi:hypothetical protein